jgi:putative transposase
LFLKNKERGCKPGTSFTEQTGDLLYTSALETTAVPWKESDKMTERMKFISRYLEGERISDLSREFGISRQTGHTLVRRYREQGVVGLQDRSSRPHRSPQRTPDPIAKQVLGLRKRHPTWGPRKLRTRLEELQPETKWPAASTIGVLLEDAGMTKKRRRRRRATPSRTPLRNSQAPNEVWCIDFKGEFRMGNRSYCYPLTVSDHHSRYLLGCEALEGTRTQETELALQSVFSEYGLPDAMRSDNGTPFASTGRLGLSKLSVWLMRLGIALERIQPGRPDQNGRHERLHLTLKQETTRPASLHILAQQERFDAFRKTYNGVRPHEALGMKPPASVYKPSKKKFPERLPSLEYPLHDHTIRVYTNGALYFPPLGQIQLGLAFIGQDVGLRELDEGTWLVSFMDLDLGYLDAETKSIIDIPTQTP